MKHLSGLETNAFVLCRNGSGSWLLCIRNRHPCTVVKKHLDGGGVDDRPNQHQIIKIVFDLGTHRRHEDETKAPSFPFKGSTTTSSSYSRTLNKSQVWIGPDTASKHQRGDLASDNPRRKQKKHWLIWFWESGRRRKALPGKHRAKTKKDQSLNGRRHLYSIRNLPYFSAQN